MAGHGPSAPETRKAGGTDNFGDTVDPDDIGRFAAQSAGWWDPEGSFRPLHLLNPIRLQFVRRELLASFGRDARALRPFEGLRLLDIGCGGGLIAEPMARLGFAVTGIDAAAPAIDMAREHAAASDLAIDYRFATAEQIAAAGERFDAVLALEIRERARFFGPRLAIDRMWVGLAVMNAARLLGKALADIIAIGFDLSAKFRQRGAHLRR